MLSLPVTSSGSIYRIYSTTASWIYYPNPAPESLNVTQITGLCHPLITLHITVTKQPKFKVASSSLSSLLDPTPLPTHPPGGDERAKKKTVKKRLFSRVKLHWNAESCLFSTQLTVTANVRNVALLKCGRSNTCDAEDSATIALHVHRPIHRTDRRYSRDALANIALAYA